MTAAGARPTLAWMLTRARSRRAARTPFVLLVVALLATGLISLLLLNASVNQGAFQLSKLRKETTRYTDEEQALQQDIDEDSAPGRLARRAQQLGMVPGGDPVFLEPGGRVRGVPGRATAPPPPPPPPVTAPAVPGSAVPTIGPSTPARSPGADGSPATGG